MLGAGPVPQPVGDLLVHLLHAGVRLLALEALPEHALTHLVEVDGGPQAVRGVDVAHQRMLRPTAQWQRRVHGWGAVAVALPAAAAATVISPP